MNQQILDEIVDKHDTAEAFIALFFAGFDGLTYCIILCIFGCDFNKKFLSHRQKLSLLIILDAIFRIINLYITSFKYSLINEIFFTLFATGQFYVILILLNQIFTDKNNESLLDSLAIKFPFLTSIAFFIFTFTLNISKIISIFQYIGAIIAILAYVYYVGGKIELFLNNVEKKCPSFLGHNFAHNLPVFIGIYLIIYYIMKLLGLFITNLLYISYLEMFGDIFKEVGKYLVFCLVISIYYLFNKYIKEEDYTTANDSNQGSVNISSVGSSNNIK